MSVSLFDTRTLTASINDIKPVHTFITSTFFKNRTASAAEYLDVEIYKGKRKAAPFVSPLIEGKLIESKGKSVVTYKPSYIKFKYVTHAYEAFQANGVFYADNKSPAQRVAEKIARELQEGRDFIDRRVEMMAVEALTTGKVTIKGDGIDEVMDFGMSPTHLKTLSGSDLWSDSGKDADAIVRDVRNWKREIVKDSGVNPTHMILGEGVIDVFMGKMLDYLDTRKIDLGIIAPQQLPNGVVYYGSLREVGLDVYGYDEWYDDGTTETPLLSTNKVLIGSSAAKTQLAHGAIKDLNSLAAAEIFVKSWEQEDPSARFVLLQSAPLPIPVQIDAFMCNQVI